MTIQSNFPALKPALLLDFQNTKQLDPRITYTRASTATYYNGVTTAMAEQNLVLQSQTFDNASWVKTTATVTADSFAAPDGTTTADTLTATNTNATLLQTFTATATAYTFSVYIYRKTGTGNVDITVDGTTYATQSITGAWVRYSITTTPTAGSKTAGIRLATNGDEVYIWGAQLENRSSATAYTATTTQAITNYIPVLQTAASGVARFDNNPTTGESLGLLIEESRTNLCLYSDQLDNASWTKGNTTVTANTIIAPDGTLTGDKLVSNTSNAQHNILCSATGGSAVYTYSFNAKAGEESVAVVDFGGAGSYVATFNLSTGVVSGVSGTTASITSFGNGWWKCVLTMGTALSLDAGYRPFIFIRQRTAFTGDGYSGLFIWGAQLEAGAFATSYIPTVASQVTRAADAASMTGTNFTSWYNQAEGTYLTEAITPVAATTSLAKIVSDDVRFVELGLNGAGAWQNFNNNGASIALQSATASALAKVTVSYSRSSSQMSANVNGNAVSSASFTSMPSTPTYILIGSRAAASDRYINSTIKKIAYYPIRLSSTNLVALTS